MKYLISLMLFALVACATQPPQQSPAQNLGQALRNGQDIFIEGQVFIDDLDFTELLVQNPLHEGIRQGKTTASVTFKNCQFRGRVGAFAKTEADGQQVVSRFLSNVSFINCEFREAVTFRAAAVLGSVDFSRSRFFASANFEEVAFHQNAYFNDCAFYGELRFQNAFFHQRANFMNTQYDSTALFQNVTAQGELQFGVAKFNGYTDFSMLHSQQAVYFNYAEFADRSLFDHAHFAGNADFMNVRFAKASFKQSRFLGQTRFHESTADSSVDFTDCFFLLEKTMIDFSEAN